MEYNFLPLKYVFERKRRTNIICICIFIALAAINIILIYRAVNIYYDLENTKSNISLINRYKNDKAQYIHSDVGVYNTFEAFNRYMGAANVNYYVNVDTKDNINAAINVDNMDNYEKYINYIEKNKNYKIKKLQAVQNGTFEMNLEVNNK